MIPPPSSLRASPSCKENVAQISAFQKATLAEPYAAPRRVETDLGLVAGPSLTDPAGG